MAKKQVESILGMPTSIDNEGFCYHEEDDLRLRQGKDTVTIVFKEDKVQSKDSTLDRLIRRPRGPDEHTRVPAELEREMDEAIARYPADRKRQRIDAAAASCGRSTSVTSATRVSAGSRESLGCSRSTFSSW